MKPLIPLALAACFLAWCVPMPSESQTLNGRFSTSVYGWQRYDTVGSSERIVRAFQTVQLEARQGDFSIQTSFLGASDLAESFGDVAPIRVSNLFARWNVPGGMADVNLGRLPVFAGVGIGTVDGLLLKARPWNGTIAVSGYGGANVMPDLRSKGLDDLSNNFFIGGQIIATPVAGGRIGVSYSNRHIQEDSYLGVRPDSLFNPVTMTIVPPIRTEQLVGGDASYNDGRWIYAYGRYERDINTKRTLRGELNARFNATPDLAVTGSAVYREPHVYYGSFFSLLPFDPVREYEGGIEYALTTLITAYGRFGYVQYSGDMSRRLTAGLRVPYASVSFSGANGYSGQLTSVSAQGMYPLWNRRIVPTLGFSFAGYRLLEGVTPRQDLFGGSAGAVYRPVPQFSFDAQIQWLRNTVASSDVRVLGKVNYWFNHNFSEQQEKGTSE